MARPARVKIALVVPGGVDPSGEYRVIPALLALLKRLAAAHEVQVFALAQQPQPAEWQLLGARVCNIGARHTVWRALRRISAAHRAAPFSVIQSLWSAVPGFVAVAAGRLLGVPSVVHVAGGELVALPAIGYGGCLTRRARLREGLQLRAAGHVTAASGPMIAALAARGVTASRIALGADLEVWPVRAPRPRGGGPARLVHVASLNRVKDQGVLLQALVALRAARVDFTMDIVGEDTLGGEIQELARTLGLAPWLRFHGFMTQRALRPVMEAADLMMLSSRHEAGPLVLHEAALAGVPTVGTAVGQIRDWAPHAARAAPVGDAARLAALAGELLADEQQRLNVARAAQAIAVRENADHTARSFEALYAQLSAR